MDAVPGTDQTHHSYSPRPELILLGFLLEKECHGYELHRRFSETLAGLWHISESQMYATLKRLEEKRLLAASNAGKGLAASRRILAPTQAGEAYFRSWLADPSPCRPRTLRLEFLTRLFFARQLAPDSLPGMIETQRSAVLESLRQMRCKQEEPGEQDPAGKQVPTGKQVPRVEGFDIYRLADDFSLAQLRSALEWIDESIIPGIQGDTR